MNTEPMPNGHSGRRLSHLRRTQQVTARMLAKQAGCAVVTVYNAELGKPVPASLGYVFESLLGTTLGYLTKGENL